MSIRAVKVAVVGCGYWGKNLVRNFAELGNLEVVCDSDETVASTMAEQYGVYCKSFEDILGDKNIDGIVIATPAVTHADLVEKALCSGKNVFVEKPLALDVQTAEHLRDLSQKENKVLMVGHLLQYHPAFMELKALVKAGRLGRLQHIYSHRLNLGKIRREENILWSFAPHDVSMILGLAQSEPTTISAMGSSYLQQNVTDVTTTHLRFANGINAHTFVSWLHPYKEQKLVVVAEKAMAVFDDTQDWGNKLTLYSHEIDMKDYVPNVNRADGEAIPLEKEEPLKLEAQHFIDCINRKVSCRTDGAEGIAVLKVLQASEKAMRDNRVINMNDPESSDSGAKKNYFVHESVCIDQNCTIGHETRIWHFSHIMRGSRIGKQCVIGQNVMIGENVSVGDHCKIQNNVSVYKGVTLMDGVFCGPSCVFTNVVNPRAEIDRKHEFRETIVNRGVTIGANATIVCGIDIGEYAFIGAGAVVVENVHPYSLVTGVPAKHAGWVCQCGERLAAMVKHNTVFECAACARRYSRDEDRLRLL